jgi:hypothetical protein
MSHPPPSATSLDPGPPQHTTLLELVVRLGGEIEDEEATVNAVSQLLRSGRVQLTGNFRDVPVEKLLAA